MSSGRSDRFRAIFRFAWRYFLIAPLILELFHFIEIFYLQALLPDMQLVAVALEPATILGGLVRSYVWNGPWCALLGTACGMVRRPPSRMSLAAFSGITMGFLIAGYQVVNDLHAFGRFLGAIDAIQYLGFMFLVFIKGAAAGCASAYFSYRPIAARADPGVFS